MKAYILTITFQNIEPIIWRKVVMPAGATFNRLHEMIQNVTNFQSEWIDEPYHFFEFVIDHEIITNNPITLENFKKDKGRNQSFTVKSPLRTKIDQYLEKYKEILYCYDLGDGWQINIKLDEIVNDYYFGYPTVLAGEGTAPPEDVGGPFGFMEFLKVYNNKSHPDFLDTYRWAEKQYFKPFDCDEVNDRLKYMKYQKTEWDKIDHENYVILSDKYRGPDRLAIDTIMDKKQILDYIMASVNLYGMIHQSKLVEIYNGQNQKKISSKVIASLANDKNTYELLKSHGAYYRNNQFFQQVIECVEDFSWFVQNTYGKPYYVPEKKELLRYVDDQYFERTKDIEILEKMLLKDFLGGSRLMLADEIEEIVKELKVPNSKTTNVFKHFAANHVFNDMEHINDYIQAFSKIANNTRIWENRGHTPNELFEMEKRHLQPIPNKKVGRNDPCPCGSGKKYKKCCGRS